MDIVNRIADLFSAMGSNARDGLDYDSEASARAAIAAMFYWLEEPSEAALEYDSKSATDQRDAWLASMRAEALTTACRIE